MSLGPPTVDPAFIAAKGSGSSAKLYSPVQRSRVKTGGQINYRPGVKTLLIIISRKTPFFCLIMENERKCLYYER